MDCCPNCFLDSELRWRVAKLSTRSGRCPSCGSVDVSIVPARDLEPYFSLVSDVYEADPDGLSLSSWMHADWYLFRVNPEVAGRLVGEMLPASAGLKYSPKKADFDSPEGSWKSLREQLAKTNRFFPKDPPNLLLMQELTGLLVVDQKALPSTLYRARIRRHEKALKLSEMGVPPAELVSGGRANPPGIPYLYMASDVSTAIAEVRPGVADVVCVAKFEAQRDYKLVDLASPRHRISPFNLDADSLHKIRSCMDFVCTLGSDLSSPAPPYRASTDYLVTQYLCELIKDLGYDGVMYASAVSKGTNIAAYDANLFKPAGRISHHLVKGIDFSIEKWPLR